MRRIVISLLLSLIVAGSVVGGVALVGKISRKYLHEHKRDMLALNEIDLNAPPDESRELFLAELQYDVGLDDQLNLLDDGLTTRLAKTFAQHPRVAKVERIIIGPGKKLHVELRYRLPVLAVPVNGTLRTVDSDGVVLPPGVSTNGTLSWREIGETPLPPMVPSGNMWADHRMLAAARTAEFLGGDRETLGLASAGATEDGEVTLWTKSGATIVWGTVPGEEKANEPAARWKASRLREMCHRGEMGAKVDLRVSGQE
jgi:hypothetical protein